MPKPSTQDSDGVAWTTTGVPLGEAGLDTRRPDAPGVLTELLNARFRDARTIERRGGHVGRLLQDRSAFTLDKRVTDDWVYGHGTRIEIGDDADWENEHHPIHIRGGGTFSRGAQDVVWTGDRLFIVKDDGPFHGEHLHWDRTPDGTGSGYGIPAFLPVMDDSYPPAVIKSSYLDTCVTDKVRLVVSATDDDHLKAILISLETGAILDTALIDGSDGPCYNVRALSSGGVPTVLWQNAAGLQVASYVAVWSAPSVLDATAATYDVCVTPGGFHVAWRRGTQIFAGRYIGANTTSTPYPFGAALSVAGTSPSGNIALSVTPYELGLVWQGDDTGPATPGLYANSYSLDLTPVGAALSISAATDPSDATLPAPLFGLAACHRGLRGSEGTTPLIVHATFTNGSGVFWTTIYELDSSTGVFLVASYTLQNAALTSKSFRVGDEVAAWLRTTNSGTNFLAAGVTTPQICGVADREDAVAQPRTGLVTWLQGIAPAGDHRFTWLRSYNAGTYHRAGNTRLGDLDFLPALSTAAFGHSVYLAGSHPRCWDGVELGDAGFHDYPVLAGTPAKSNGSGSLTATGTYRFRVYLTRYNKAGERFMSAALTSDAVVLAGAEDTITVNVTSTALTNHDDLVLEFYRTESGGTTYYLEGTVANDRSVASMSFQFGLSDSALRLKPGDPHAPQLGVARELEELGPLGCRIFVVAGDRLWGAGGQVPAGCAQFSKLYESGEGVGFSDIDSVQVIDATGGEITSLASRDSILVAFQPRRVYLVTGNGPDNYGNGTFGVPEDQNVEGASTHLGTADTPLGIVFWSDGPRLLASNFRSVLPISEPVAELAASMTPTGVRVDPRRREVVWYTAEGDALLWSYASENSRWARWTGLPVAGCSPRHLVTTDGRLLTPAETPLDDGRRFEFAFRTGNIRLEAHLAGANRLREVGITGKHNGTHNARFAVYYNGAALWDERYWWHPQEGSYLMPPEVWDELTPEEVDALEVHDRSGAYSHMRRVERQECRFFQVAASDLGDAGFTPWELDLVIGAKPGRGRSAINTFTKD